MAYSYVRYTGNGSTTNYTFPFPYIAQDHIKVRVNSVLVTTWSFLNSSTIQFVSAPAAAAVIEIRRETPKETAIVNFTDGSVLLERDLDLLATFDLYLAQETKDGLDSSITQTSLGVWDAQSKRVTNVADPVNAQDAVTKNWVETTYTPTISAFATAAASSATASAGSATASANSATAAAASYDSFDDRYLGAKAVAPTTDNDGQALITGTIYWDTPSSQMFTWNGTSWRPTFLIGNTVRSVVTATAGQTVVATPTYLIGSNTLQVFVNGVKVLLSADYTETTQNSITFVSGLTLGGEVELIAQQAFAVDELRADLASGAVGKGSSLVSYLPGGTGAVATTAQAKLRESVSVKDFGAVGDGVTDDYAAFAAALSASKRVYVPNPSVKYLISYPLVLDDDQQLIGESRETCIIEKTTTNLPSPALGIFSGTRAGIAFNYDYDKNAVVIIKKPAGRAYPNSIGIHNITLKAASGVSVEYGVYAPRLSRSRFTQVYITGVANGWFTYDSWMCTFEGVECKDVSYGFRWENDNTGTGSGTSCTFIGCFANIVDVYGWYLYGLVYSSIIASASESVVAPVAGDRPVAWFFNLCKGLTVVGCGSEVVKGYTFRISGGSVDIRGGRFDGLTGDTFGTSTAVVFLDSGAKVSIGGGARFEAVTSPGNIYNEFVAGSGSLLTYDETVTRPSGGTAAFTGTGGRIDDPSASVAWTPTVIGSGTAGTATYSTQEGFYTRIGNVVYYTATLTWTGGTGTGNLYIAGLPFTSKNTSAYATGAVQPGSALTVSASKVAACQVIPNTANIRLIELPVATGTVTLIPYQAAANASVTGFYFV